MKFKSPEWNAWYNVQPGNPPTLHVTALIDAQEEGLDIDIKFHSLLKRNPPILVLQLETKTIFIPREPGDTVVRVHYQQTTMPGSYHSILILDQEGNQIKEIDGKDIGMAW